MSLKPIFVATHPRACSTAFERVFMTRRDELTCIHEPFGDAFYFGPERLSERYEKDEKARVESGFDQSTYQTVIDRLAREKRAAEIEGKRIFIKDIAHYLFPPNGSPASIAPSLFAPRKGVGTTEVGAPSDSNTKDSTVTNGKITNGASTGASAVYPYPTDPEPGNPTVIPTALLSEFHFTFLIRHPRSSIPSYYRCTIPPLDAITGFSNFVPSESGYDELRRLFDYLREKHLITGESTSASSEAGQVKICVVDADDLLDDPAGIIKAYCASVGVKYDPTMLKWDTPEDHNQAKAAFEKWHGFHEDAIQSSELRPRAHKPQKSKSQADHENEWKKKFGEEGFRIIQKTVEDNVADYEYLKEFAIKPLSA